METVILVVSVAIGIVSLVCWILTIVKAFQNQETLLGILSICPLVGFIIGWVKVKEWNHQQIMVIWTIVVVINLIFSAATPALGS